MAQNTLHFQDIVRKLPLNSIYESFKEGRLLLTLFSLAA